VSERTRLEWIGHRGAKREQPENTLPAFRRAFERGADAVELDVHATADGVVVVHHDASAHSKAGGLITIADAHWDAVQTVEFAGGAGIPRLSDVLDATPSGARVYVEIKGRGIEALVAATIRESRARCAVHSFDHASISLMRDLAPEIPRGVLFEDRVPDLAELMRRTGARDVWPHWPLVDAALIETVHALGGRVICWTVNDRAAAERLASAGVDGLCGDDVRVFAGLGRNDGDDQRAR
jgi:glycerophosphoryl diester phosphodiesterase